MSRDRQPQLRQPVGAQPDAHRVVARAEHADVGDARHALELIDQIDRCVVRQEQSIAAVVRRNECYQNENIVRPFLHGHAVTPHLVGQPRQCELHTVVDVEHRRVDVRADVERRSNRQVAGGGGAGVEVQKMLDAGESLLDRRSHCLGDRLGTRARIARIYDDCRRRDVGILRDRQGRARDQTGDHDDDRDDSREHRTVDEELREHVSWPLRRPPAVARPSALLGRRRRHQDSVSSGCRG